MISSPLRAFDCDRTTVIGAGAMGSALPAVLGISPENVLFIDLARPSGCADKLLIGDVVEPSDEVLNAISQSDLVVMALPRSVADAAFPKIANAIPNQAIVVETTSTKTGTDAWASLSGGVRLVGLNPLFAPNLCWKGRPVVIVPHVGAMEDAALLSTHLTKKGCQAVELSADEHDRWLAYRQGAAHALALALADLLKHKRPDWPGPLVGSLPYQVMMLPMARMLSGNPDVFAEIQVLNPYASDVRKRLIEALSAIDAPHDAVLQNIESLAVSLSGHLDPAVERCAKLYDEPIFPFRKNQVTQTLKQGEAHL